MENVVHSLLAIATANFLLVSNAHAQPGSVAFSFDPGSSVDFTVFPVASQSNGKIIIGGSFGTPSSGLARLNADGSPDKSFNVGAGVSPGFGYTPGFNYVYALAGCPRHHQHGFEDGPADKRATFLPRI